MPVCRLSALVPQTYELTFCASALLAGQTRPNWASLYRIHFYEKPMRHETTIDKGTNEKLVINKPG